MRSRYSTNQSGLVSIMIASVLMVIMALITLGFTRVVQSEQRQSIDNQLSKQAFFAAESGINIAASTPGFPGSLKNDCDTSAYNNGEVANGNTDVTFTCLMINPNPTSIDFGNDSITTGKSKVVPIRTNPAAISLVFEWSDSNSNAVQASCGTQASPNLANLDFEANPTAWNKIAAVRLDIIGVPVGAFSRTQLINSQFSAILYPCDSASEDSIAYSSLTAAGSVGRIIPVDCQNSGTYECRLEITGINPSSIYREHYAKFNALFGEINVRITAPGASGSLSQFANAQAVVDSTGRAVDVYRRLQARVPLYETYVTPNASIQTLDDICKLYQVRATEIIDGC